MAKDDDIISEAKEAYRLGIDAERDNRETYVEDYRFSRLDEHWPDDVKKARVRDGRPCLSIPKLPAFIRQVVNDSRQNRPRIKVKPVDSEADPKTAQVLSGLILNIENASNADAAYDTAIECAVSGGFGYFRIDVEYPDNYGFDKELRINRIANPLTVVGDPYSQAVDSCDWNSAFVTTLLTKDEFERKYKGAAQSSWFEADYSSVNQPWRDGDEILTAEWWKRDEVEETLYKLSDQRVLKEKILLEQADILESTGITVIGSRKSKGYKVKQYLLTGAEVIDTVDWAGCYIPIIPVYGEELNIEGKRIFRSMIANAKDAQRRLNYWVSAATEIVALAPKTPYIGEEKAFTSEPQKWATVNTHSHAYLTVPKGVPIPQRQPLDGGQAVGAISQALAAADDIKAILGMYDASLGQRSNETSGKAIMARQREGDVSQFHFSDNLARSQKHAGTVLVDLIPAVYTHDTIVRVIGQDGRAATAKVGPRPPEMGKPQYAPLDDGVPEGTEHIFDFGVGRYDVTVDTGPSFTTRREETSQQMIELIRAVPDAARVIGDKLVKNLDWPEAEEISERLKKMMPQQAGDGMPPEMQQMIQKGQQMLQEQGKQIETLTRETAVLKAEKQLTDKQHKIDLSEKDLIIQEMRALDKIGNAANQMMNGQPATQ